MNQEIRDKLDRYSYPEPNTGCWLWIGATDRDGYGAITKPKDKKNYRANRVSYEEYVGPIHPGMVVCHRCDTPQCINPDHLFLGTKKENAEDCSRKGRTSGQKKTHCPQGHPYSGENVFLDNLARKCRICVNKRALEYHHKHRDIKNKQRKMNYLRSKGVSI